MKAVKYLVAVGINLFTVLKKLKECAGFFFFNNLIATNVSGLCVVALSKNLKLTTTLDRAITQNPCYVPFLFRLWNKKKNLQEN
jgi:hypothetical protein